MDMKKIHWMIPALGLLLAGCQQDELPTPSGSDGDYIRFATPAIRAEETATKSVTQDVLEAGQQFGVLGYCVPYQLGQPGTYDYNGGSSLWRVKHTLCPPSVFYNTPVTVGDGGCTYSPLKQWYTPGHGLDGEEVAAVGNNADNYLYTFFAYYPYREGNQVFSVDAPANGTTAGAPKFTFSMPQQGTSTGDALDHTATPDAMFAVAINHQKTDGSVDFTFSHLLTALGFEVNNFSEYDLQVHSIKLSGQFFRQIVLDFTQQGSMSEPTFPANYYYGAYTIFDETANGGQPLTLNAPAEGNDRTTSGLLPKNTSGEGEHILLVSGEAPYFGPVTGDPETNANVVQVTIDYTFADGNQPERRTAHYGRPSTFTPAPGTKYTAQLNFVGNAFVLQFVVNNNETWEDGGSDNDDIIFE